MTRQVTLAEAQTQLPYLIEAVKNGDTIVIKQGETPVAHLVAVPSAKRNAKFGSANGLLTISDDFDAPMSDLIEYMQ